MGMRMEYYKRLGETAHMSKLDNGLQIIVVPKPGYAKKYAFFATRYGGMDTRFELDGKWLDTPAGIAHYLEHKTFDTEDGNALQTLALNGADPNAFTSNDMTGYYFDSTEKFEENLDILLKFVSIPYYTPESVEKERGIIAQEIRMTEDEPDWQIYMRMLRAMYAKHTARVAIAGTVESIQDITADVLNQCHKAFYTPSNMILTVVGDVDPARIEETALRILPKSGGPEIARDYGDETDEIPEHETRIDMEVSSPQFLAGFKCPPAPRGEARLRQSLIGELAGDILLGDSSPLYQKLYEAGLINGSFGGDYDLMPGLACFYAGGESRDSRAVTDEILKEAARLGGGAIDPDFFERIRRANYGAWIRSLNSFENIAVSLTEGYFNGYNPFRFPDIFESVTLDDIAAFLRENIVEDRMVLSEITPKEN